MSTTIDVSKPHLYRLRSMPERQIVHIWDSGDAGYRYGAYLRTTGGSHRHVWLRVEAIELIPQADAAPHGPDLAAELSDLRARIANLETEQTFILEQTAGEFVEIVKGDRPSIVRDISAPCAVLLDMETRKIVGLRVYASRTALEDRT